MRIAAVLIAGVLAGSALGQGTVPGGPDRAGLMETMPTLWQGDPAPALQVGKWLNGAPVAVTGFERGKVYVIEFWATWCQPCIASMPHLSEVQAKYRDRGVTVVSITREDPHNTLEKAEAMVKEKAETMAYSVAWDDAGKTYDAYMLAARQGGIPCAFLIDGAGKLVWIGHPMKLDDAIDGLLAGRLDVKAEAAAAREWHAKDVAGRKAFHAFETAKKGQDWPGLVKACRELEATGLGNYGFAYGEELETLLVQMKDLEGGYALARRLVEREFHDDAAGLSRVAWTITAFDLERRDLELAEAAAKRGIEVGPGNPFVWRALGAVEFRRGNKERAQELMKKGIEVAGDEEWSRGELERALKWVNGEIPGAIEK